MSSVLQSPIGPATTAKRGTMSAADFAKLAGYPSAPLITSVPSANGLSLAAGVLALAAADGSNAGALTADAQAVGGLKTFNAGLVIPAGQSATFGTAPVSAVPSGLGFRITGGTTTPAIKSLGSSTYFYGSDETNGYLQWNGSLWHFNASGVSAINTMTGGFHINSATGVNSIGLVTAGARISLYTSDASSYLYRSAANTIATPGALHAATVYGSTSISGTGVGMGLSGLGVLASSFQANFQSGWGLADNASAESFRFLSTTTYTDEGASIAGFRNSNLYATAPVFKIKALGDIDLTVAGRGVILTQPDGGRRRLTLDNAGALAISALL